MYFLTGASDWFSHACWFFFLLLVRLAHSIDDPWDVDGNGIFKYAQTQVTNEQLIVVDDYCVVAGTDTNFPCTWLEPLLICRRRLVGQPANGPISYSHT